MFAKSPNCASQMTRALPWLPTEYPYSKPREAYSLRTELWT